MNSLIQFALLALPVIAAALLAIGLAIIPDTPARRERSWLLISAGMGTILCFATLALLPLLA